MFIASLIYLLTELRELCGASWDEIQVSKLAEIDLSVALAHAASTVGLSPASTAC